MNAATYPEADHRATATPRMALRPAPPLLACAWVIKACTKAALEPVAMA